MYIEPKVDLLHTTPLVVAEIAARTAYDSFHRSEHDDIVWYPYKGLPKEDIESSKIMHQLAWVNHHYSVIEHLVLQFHIKDIGRGVLQELSRHRISSPTVRSTRFAMSPILIAYAIAKLDYFYGPPFFVFNEIMKTIGYSIFDNEKMLEEETSSIYNKLDTFIDEDMDTFYNTAFSTAQKDILENHKVFEKDDHTSLFDALINAKQKRNAGDQYKFIVTDNFKTELIWTINLRSLKNFLDLRDSGAAWFQIRALAQEIKKQMPEKYRKLIEKEKK